MTLSSRITAFTVAILLLVVISLIVIGLLGRNQSLEQTQEAWFTGNSLLLDKLISVQYDRMQSVIEVLEDEFDLRTALKQGITDDVNQYAGRFEELTAGLGDYEQMVIYNRDQQPVYSSTKAAVPSDVVSLLATAEESKDPQFGLVTLGDGSVVTIYIDRAESRRKTFGYFLLLQSIPELVEEFSQNLGQGVSLLGADGQLQFSSSLWQQQEFDTEQVIPNSTGLESLHRSDFSFLMIRQSIDGLFQPQMIDLVIAVEATETLKAQQFFDLLALFTVIVIAIAGLLALAFILKFYLAPLKGVANTASEIAKGNLNLDVKVTGVGEIATLEESMIQMTLNLKNMVSEIGQIADLINSSAQSVDENAARNHQNFASQNQGFEQISDSLMHAGDSIASIATNADDAANTAQSIQKESTDSNRAIAKNQASMQQLQDNISDATQSTNELHDMVTEVSSISGLIQSISEQTNLLALNAAIEAARAGEMGRGFAVVADEVRTLASRTKESTDQIEAIIHKLMAGAKDTVEHMDQASEMVASSFDQNQKANSRLTQIHEHISRMDQLNQSISSQVAVQNEAIQQVGDNMGQISASASETLESSKQVQAASQKLSELSAMLKQLTDQFDYGTNPSTSEIDEF